jgi:hypothetical protein
MKFILGKKLSILRTSVRDKSLIFLLLLVYTFFLGLKRSGKRDKSRRERDRSTDLP